MVDTPRTLAEIQALFADNSTKNISPQDLRDFVASIMSEYGSIYVNNGVTAQGSIDTTFVQVLNFDTNNGAAGNVVADQANNEIIIGTAGDYFCMASIAFTGSNNITFEYAAPFFNFENITDFDQAGK